MPLRKALFWIHLTCGLVAGTVIALMSVTGIAIAFEEEILAWKDRDVRQIAPRDPTIPRLSVSELAERVRAARPEFGVTAVVVPRRPELACEFYAGREGPLYVNPYSGEARESQAHAAHDLIHKLEEWHRWLGRPDGANSPARLVTGIGNFAFLVLCLTGLYLWWPRAFSRRAFRPLLRLVANYRGKAREFNWHNVFGFWSMPVLTVLAATGVVISFEWGHRLVFAAAGEEAPKSRNYGMMAVPMAVVPTPATGARRATAEELIASAQRAFPEWQSIRLDLPKAGAQVVPVRAGVTLPDSMPGRAFVPVELDPFTGAVLQATRFQERSAGLQARVWIRFLHTGAAFGLPGKIVAVLATAASLVLVYTGFALAWRRFFRRSRTAVVS